MSDPIIIVVMGVSGSGKTTIGRRLAADLGWNFHDGDDDHSHEAISRMKRGEPLTRKDRLPWLQTLAARIRDWCGAGTRTVLACSALTEEARQILVEGCSTPEQITFVHLHGSYEAIYERIRQREHFMPASLLRSQYETLERPGEAIEIDASAPPESIVAKIRDAVDL